MKLIILGRDIPLKRVDEKNNINSANECSETKKNIYDENCQASNSKNYGRIKKGSKPNLCGPVV